MPTGTKRTESGLPLELLCSGKRVSKTLVLRRTNDLIMKKMNRHRRELAKQAKILNAVKKLRDAERSPQALQQLYDLTAPLMKQKLVAPKIAGAAAHARIRPGAIFGDLWWSYLPPYSYHLALPTPASLTMDLNKGQMGFDLQTHLQVGEGPGAGAVGVYGITFGPTNPNLNGSMLISACPAFNYSWLTLGPAMSRGFMWLDLTSWDRNMSKADQDSYREYWLWNDTHGDSGLHTDSNPGYPISGQISLEGDRVYTALVGCQCDCGSGGSMGVGENWATAKLALTLPYIDVSLNVPYTRIPDWVPVPNIPRIPH
jgi:hypothetical protein